MNVSLRKPIDCFIFKVKAKDLGKFGQNELLKMNYSLFNKNKPYQIIFENPEYNRYVQSVQYMKYTNWATKNLKNRGFDIKSPIATDPETIFKVCLVKSTKANKLFDKKFTGIRDYINYHIAIFKSVKTTQKLIQSMNGEMDAFDATAIKFLYRHEMNKFDGNRFQKFLSKFNIREIEYKPKNN